jgi:esterase
MLEFAETEKLKRFFLAGHSMGGKCAVSFALKWPELLNGLLVADVSPFRDNRSLGSEYQYHHHILTTINNIDPGLIKSRSDAEKELSASIDDASVRGFILKNLRRESDNTFSWKLNAKGLLENLGRITEAVGFSHHFTDPSVGFPVIFIRGELSQYLPEEDFPVIKNVFPSAEFYTIPGAGHWVHADNPDEVIKNFMRLLEAAS